MPYKIKKRSREPGPLLYLSVGSTRCGRRTTDRYTKGSFTTSARSRRPRTSTAISDPGFANSGFT